jgi:hypothetical protein
MNFRNCYIPSIWPRREGEEREREKRWKGLELINNREKGKGTYNFRVTDSSVFPTTIPS